MTNTTNYAGIDYGRGQANIDQATGICYGVIAQNSIAPEAMVDVFSQSRDLTYEGAIEDVKQRISQIESQEDLCDLLDDVIGSRTGRLVCYERAEQVLVGCPLPLDSEGIEAVWDAIFEAVSDCYDDCGEHDWLYEQDGYKLSNCLQSDVMVLASPYFTYAQYCSPCVPGACNLDSPLEHEQFTVTQKDVERNLNICPTTAKELQAGRYGFAPISNRAYCLGHDFFEGGVAPYPVYAVATGQLV